MTLRNFFSLDRYELKPFICGGVGRIQKLKFVTLITFPGTTVLSQKGE